MQILGARNRLLPLLLAGLPFAVSAAETTVPPPAATVPAPATVQAPVGATIAGPAALTAPGAATAATPAAAAPPAAALHCSDWERLRTEIHRAIYAALKYPAQARYYASTGVTAVEYDYYNGQVSDVHMTTSSGDRMLDRVALAAVRNAAYPSAPAFANKPIRDVVYVIFDNTGRLQRNSYGAQHDSGSELAQSMDTKCTTD